MRLKDFKTNFNSYVIDDDYERRELKRCMRIYLYGRLWMPPKKETRREMEQLLHAGFEDLISKQKVFLEDRISDDENYEL